MTTIAVQPAADPPGENATDYDEVLARVSSAMKPSDILEENWGCVVFDLVWEAFRLRRPKANLMVIAAHRARASSITVRKLAPTPERVAAKPVGRKNATALRGYPSRWCPVPRVLSRLTMLTEHRVIRPAG